MKAILIGVCLPESVDFKENINEMINLADACGIEVVDTITQNLRTIHKQTYINSGKIDEIIQRMEDLDIDTLLFDCELSPSKLRNLDEILHCNIIDKTNLILQIFELRAQTKEAKLQVEVAQLKYMLPRLIGSYTGMDKQRGGKNKGTGEKKINLDTRHIGSRIHSLESEIKTISKQRETQRKQRNKKEIKSVALVGYTNAGKSSVMNQVMSYFKKDDKQVYEENMLFATLTTSTRNIKLDNNHEFVLSDTVGFVSDLPHTLIKAFHSTLEEVIEADLLLHIVDVSNPEYQKQMRITLDTLQEIGANEIETLTIFNKCDLTETTYPKMIDNQIYISAKDNQSISYLLHEIDKKLFQSIHTSILLPYSKGSLLSILNNSCNIIKQEHRNDGTFLELEVEHKYYELIKEYEINHN